MRNDELREELQHQYDNELIFFDMVAYDNSIIGITTDNRVVYSFSQMVEELSRDLEIDELDAIEWIEYNTIRASAYFSEPNAPIIVYDVIRGDYE